MRLFLLLVFLIPTLAFGAPPALSTESVDVYRVSPTGDKRKGTGKKFYLYKVLAGPRRISPAAARAITRELERIYQVDWPSLYCAFVPRYAIRLHRPTGTVDVLICPHCGEAHFIMGKRLRKASVSGDIFRQLNLLFPDFPPRDNEA